ncbi:hypothetical protein [Sulfurospirillum diekertiae]|uniref:Uncharacterized protein n=1 Tax=Sulfurospirillum diekertiae TaxID=1854492 RepID=A0A1Y0HKP2_9BACT|nr:hypothetical protein [Sulfurospirillum diekertiae]ARU47944.1 hypothetical protein Sdiek1_0777 [Sulfurospirillum diekertiae]ASC92791.1 hypothetical protein Sdiek2_0769 [Sulfurospirillum diekertiae]
MKLGLLSGMTFLLPLMLLAAPSGNTAQKIDEKAKNVARKDAN